jgi:ATP-binding cassette subfamily B protein
VRFAVALQLRSSPRRAALVIAMTLAGALSSPLIGLALRALTNAVLSGRVTTAALAGAAAGLLAVTSLTMSHFAHNVLAELGERADIAIDSELISLVHSAPGLAVAERPDYADRLSLLRDELSSLTYITQGILESVAIAVQIALTVILLVQLQPLLLLLPVFALAPLVAGRYAQRIDERARLGTAEQLRLARSFLGLAAQPGPAREIRLFGLAGELQRRQRDALTAVEKTLTRAELTGTAVRSAGQIVFAAAYVGALLLVVREAIAGRRTPGDVVLVIVLARQVSQAVGQLLSVANMLQGAGRIAVWWRWLAELAGPATRADRDGGNPPAALRRGIELRGVRFSYPEAKEPALDGIDLLLPAGSVVAVVGENGAGKSTLVKLLCRLYEPDEGSILVDQAELSEMPAAAWQARVTTAFQDYCRLEFRVRETVGAGDLRQVSDAQAVARAVDQASASDVILGLPDGLETELGASFPAGRELSGGQWQKLALGRAMMRDTPLLIALDEPSAALDAMAEYALFQSYADVGRQARADRGAVVLLISHRFSTVSMADQIIVLDRGRIAEQGTHAELLAAGGQYAALYQLQAAAYR